MSQVIKDSIRREEIFARYGGEEFSIIMPEAPKKSAVTLAEKVRQLIEETIFSFEGHVVPVTISLGVSALDKSISSALELIAFADKNLYRAKHNGRNCVVG
jgi:diguanylate cyclase (GGDEF)-like protein